MKRRISIGVLLAAAVTVAAVGATSTSATATPLTNATLVKDIALARVATTKYVNNLARAKADGFGIITQMIPNMGIHYLNPNVKGFDVRKPPILVYEKNGSAYQLGAVEWVFTSKPAKPPIPGATYGSFGAGCHYKDGTFIPADAQSGCPTSNPQTASAFNFWHPLLITLHLWVWYPNPSGIFASLNPLVAPFNQG
jgi:hypothetical protein